MKIRQTKSKRGAITLVPGTTIGIAVSTAITLLLAGAASILILNGSVPDTMMQYISIAIIFLSCFIGSYFGGKIIEDKKLIGCILSGGLYFLIILATKILVFEGAYSQIIPTIISFLAGMGLAAVLILKPKRQRTVKKIGKIKI